MLLFDFPLQIWAATQHYSEEVLGKYSSFISTGHYWLRIDYRLWRDCFAAVFVAYLTVLTHPYFDVQYWHLVVWMSSSSCIDSLSLLKVSLILFHTSFSYVLLSLSQGHIFCYKLEPPPPPPPPPLEIPNSYMSFNFISFVSSQNASPLKFSTWRGGGIAEEYTPLHFLSQGLYNLHIICASQSLLHHSLYLLSSAYPTTTWTSLLFLLSIKIQLLLLVAVLCLYLAFKLIHMYSHDRIHIYLKCFGNHDVPTYERQSVQC